MKVELHLHTSRYSDCATNTPEEMMAELLRSGYHAVFITEHNAVWPGRELNELRGQFPGLRIFPGVERQLHAHHILVLGTNDREYLEVPGEMELLERARSLGHLTVLAHPYRYEGGADLLEQRLRPDAMEHLTNNHLPEPAMKARDAAESFGLPLVNAGDSHSLGMIGQFWIETRWPLRQAQDVRRAVVEGAYENRTHLGAQGSAE